MAQCQHHINKGAVNKFSTGKNIYIYISVLQIKYCSFSKFFFLFFPTYILLYDPWRRVWLGKTMNIYRNLTTRAFPFYCIAGVSKRSPIFSPFVNFLFMLTISFYFWITLWEQMASKCMTTVCGNNTTELLN